MSILSPYVFAHNPELMAFESAWVKYIKNDEFLNNTVIRKEVRRSWQRCKEAGLDPLSREPIPLLNEQELSARIQKSSYVLETAEPFLATLFNIIKDSGFKVDFIDSDGCVLKSYYDSSVEEMVNKTFSCVGAVRSEEVAGTNASSLAITEKKPFQISGGEHYMQQFHRWSCSASPILDHDNNVLGVVNLSGRYEKAHDHTLALVAYVTKAIENALKVHEVNMELQSSNEKLNEILKSVSDGIIYTNNGIIEGINKEMCEFIGEKEENVIGKKIGKVINTIPDLKQWITSDKSGYQNQEIVLIGKGRTLNCLLDIRNTATQPGGKAGEIFIFTRVEEVQLMAEKITHAAKYEFDDIIAESPMMKETIQVAKKAAIHGSRVLIHGESGTGKEMFAQAIHNYSSRKYNSFIAVDCGAIPRELFEAELFGYEEGAFTGAKSKGKVGLIELANKGTLFLDEIGNMPLESQQKLLRTLQEGSFHRVGGSKEIEIDARIIAATNADLKKAIESGTFREDLYYRLDVFNIELPPLRERREDISAIIKHYVEAHARNRKVTIDKEALQALVAYDWPGNARELNNAIERAIIMSKGGRITKSDLPLDIGITKTVFSEKEKKELTLDEAMKIFAKEVLENNKGNLSKTARQLNISRSTLYRLLKSKHDDEKNS